MGMTGGPHCGNAAFTEIVPLSIMASCLWSLGVALWLDSRRVSNGFESFQSGKFGPFVRCSRRVSHGCEKSSSQRECALLLQQRIAPNRVSEKRID